MHTALERAEQMARRVVAAAQQENTSVVTRDLVEAVMSRCAHLEPGQVNAESVRQRVRAQAPAAGVRVIFTDDERYWAIRGQLHHMTGEEVHALRDSIADGGDSDPRAHDRVLIDAISVRLSNRPVPRRLDDTRPMPVHLWDEGPKTDTLKGPCPSTRATRW